ncbi:hypothetical protein [Litoreibacter meonggei]|nr:hypothetical protein [Litoreibacter meonggei]
MSLNAPLQEQTRLEIKELCRQMIEGEIGYIEGTRLILSRATDAGLKDHDSYLMDFIGIASETDIVPTSQVLKMWSAEAVAKKSPYWAELETWAKEFGEDACRKLHSRW